MKRNFTNQCLEVQGVKDDKGIIFNVSSDYADSERKGQLYVREEYLSQEIERFWKSVKTKKLSYVHASFGMIDWYDSDIDVYTVPTAVMKRGLRKAKIGHNTHGSVPKDWSFDVSLIVNEVKTTAPSMEVLDKLLGSYLTTAAKKEVVKGIKEIIKGDSNSFYVSLEEE